MSYRVNNLHFKLGVLMVVTGAVSFATLFLLYHNRACDLDNNNIGDVLGESFLTCNVGSQPGNANETVVFNAAKACYAVCAGISAASMSAVEDRLSAAGDEMSRLVSSSTTTMYNYSSIASGMLYAFGFVWALSAAGCCYGHGDTDNEHQTSAIAENHRPLLSDISPV
ncbi:MAG: hypothetical protein P1U40_09320 [Coxiellaceae bacterium]|nr:hypothetical protein [Coxiellaceae bacterium]